MAIERATTVGTDSVGMSYGNPFSNDEFPKNQLLDNKLVYTMSTDFRWASRKKLELFLYVVPFQSDFYKFTLKTENEAQSNIPVQQVVGQPLWQYKPYIIRNEGYDQSSDDHGIIAAARIPEYNSVLGMNITNKGEYTASIRPVTDWNYNKVAIYPVIKGIYAHPVPPIVNDLNLPTYVYIGNEVHDAAPNVMAEVDLYDFYDNHTRPTSNNNLVGYSIGYRILIQHDTYNIEDGSQYFNFISEIRITGDISLDPSIVFEDYYQPQIIEYNTLYGLSSSTEMYVLHGDENDYRCYTFSWVGEQVIEGIPMSKM